MKISTTCLPLFGIAALMSAASLAAEPVMRDAATHDELSAKLRVANNENPMKKFIPAEGPDPSKAEESTDLSEMLDFISYNGIATVVPKKAILSIPPSVADRIKLQPGHKVQSWQDFYAANRGWITTVEVSRAQAEGNLALGEELTKRIGKSSSLVVATYQGGPISVLPLKAPVETAKIQKPTTAQKP